MEQPGGQIWVRTFGDKVCIRVQGRATHLHAAPFQTFAKEMVGQGHHAFEIDLGPCTSMDSTFLGVLVGLSFKLEKLGHFRPTLYRVAPRTYELFKTLGVERYFELNGPGTLMTDDFSELSAPACQPSEWATTVINAHQLLVEVDDRNGPRFQELLDYLRQDLAHRPPGQAVPDAAGQPTSAGRWKH